MKAGNGVFLWVFTSVLLAGLAVAADSQWEDDELVLWASLCGCRVEQYESGTLSGRVCGCQVFESVDNDLKSDLLLIGAAMLGLMALSTRQK